MLRKNPRARQMAAGYLFFISGELIVTQPSPFGYNDQFLVRYIIFVQQLVNLSYLLTIPVLFLCS
ncbi:hypothetical protein BGP68_02000 [Escherichia coli]|nr:hypothetical protein BGP68_02000 [Escherichia coli]ORR86536.1 hypothetical protein BGP69_01715 [Escherichia coli]ORR98461.1 hypothetical protein BGP67_01710 [Escherichia coli]